MHSHSRLRRTPRPPLPALYLTLVLVMATIFAPASALAQEATPVPDAPGAAETVEPAASDSESAVTATVTLAATQDSYISSGFPDTNFAGSTNLNLGWQSGGQNAMRMLLQFDLSSIPRNAVINSAEYRIFQSQVIPVGDGNMDFRAQFMTRRWNENSVTWNNANFLGGASLPLGDIPGTVGWQSGSATGIVQAWVSGQQPNFGVLITGDEVPANNRMRVFYARGGRVCANTYGQLFDQLRYIAAGCYDESVAAIRARPVRGDLDGL